MRQLKRLFAGGSTGNEQLTAVVAAILLLLLAIEGATLLQLRSLLTVHAFVGMLLIPIVVLKLASTGWRALRYYSHAEEYVAHGPPHLVLRVLVAPVIVLSTLVLFATGVALLVLDETHGTLVGLHKASFIVWVGVMSIHVLAYATRAGRRVLADFGHHRVGGAALRQVLLLGALAVGLLAAVLTLPIAEHWHHH